MSDTTESLERQLLALVGFSRDACTYSHIADLEQLGLNLLAELKERDASIDWLTSQLEEMAYHNDAATDNVDRLTAECEEVGFGVDRLRAAATTLAQEQERLGDRYDKLDAECERLRKALVLAEDTMIRVNDWYADRIRQARTALEGEDE